MMHDAHIDMYYERMRLMMIERRNEHARAIIRERLRAR